MSEAAPTQCVNLLVTTSSGHSRRCANPLCDGVIEPMNHSQGAEVSAASVARIIPGAFATSYDFVAAMESSPELPTPSLKWFGQRKINLRKAAICLLLSSVNRVLSRPSKKPISEHPIQSHFLCGIAGPPFLVRASGPAAPVGK